MFYFVTTAADIITLCYNYLFSYFVLCEWFFFFSMFQNVLYKKKTMQIGRHFLIKMFKELRKKPRMR